MKALRRMLFLAQIGKGHPLGQAAGARDLDAIGINLHENIDPLDEPVAMHDGVGDGLAQSLHRVLGDVLAAQTLDSPGGAGIALDEAQRIRRRRCWKYVLNERLWRPLIQNQRFVAAR